jgi:hypothetical protein
VNAGRELDALVAEKVIGIPVKKFEDGSWLTTTGENIEPYSTDIAAAWEVVEHMRTTHWLDVFSLMSPSDESKFWFAGFEKKWHGRSYAGIYDREAGDTAPHAICAAALKAVSAG